MYKYSSASKTQLNTLDSRLAHVFHVVAEYWNTTIIEGHRPDEKQAAAFAAGKSKLDGVTKKSEHQTWPSRAVDAAPYPIDWGDIERIKAWAGTVLAIGGHLGYKIRWGGDWDRDYDQHDQSFNDLVHFEIID